LAPVLLGLVFYFVAHAFLLLFIEQGGNHTDGEQVVDKLQEAFLDYVSICEEEKDRALTKHCKEAFEIFSEFLLFVASCERNGKDLVFGREGCKLSETLFS
jgi:hypothetical protein